MGVKDYGSFNRGLFDRFNRGYLRRLMEEVNYKWYYFEIWT